MAMAESLLEALHKDGYDLGEAALEPVRNWFASGITTESNSKELSAELNAGLRVGGGLPGLIKLFAGFTTAKPEALTNVDAWLAGAKVAIEGGKS